ncbi:MAG: cofactor-independent phosphoglycerate mutase [Clostridia bacterium]
MKYAVVLGDGMADYPVEELGGKTPLEVANHPAMDYLAQNGTFGLVQTIPEGMNPGSDTANLAVFGYDPRIYYSGRSPLEAASLGITLNLSDVTYRCNFVTLSGSDDMEQTWMQDYSAGEISSAEAAQLVTMLNLELGRDGVALHPGFSYRQCLVLRNADTGAQLTPPHDISGQSVRGKLPFGTNGALLYSWMERAYAMLRNHPVNRARIAAGKNPANAIWFWGEGRKPSLTPFLEKNGLHGAVVSAVDLVQGIGKCAEMQVLKVDGATGTYTTNFSGKAEAAIHALATDCDYVYIHLEAPDECGHHHQIPEKIFSIEQIDQKVLIPVLRYLEDSGEDYTVLLMPDHPTPLSLRTHVSDPVPYVIYRRGDHAGHCCRYTEQDAAATKNLITEGHTLMQRMICPT